MSDKKYITVAYKLYTDNSAGIHEIVEEATAEYPFQFISNMGTMLPAFEEQVATLEQGAKFDFRLTADEAYGLYLDERVLDLDKSMFCVNGHFDSENIYPGNVIPLVNEDGNRFEGLVLEIKDNVVVVDLNHPLAGKQLHFVGEVLTSRPATEEEIDALIARLAGHADGGCGCGSGGCGCHGDEDEADASQGGCCGGGCGCGH